MIAETRLPWAFSASGLGIDDRGSDAAANDHGVARIVDVGLFAQRPDYIRQVVAGAPGAQTVVVAPMAWMIRVMVPAWRSAWAMVNGMRSPFSSERTMTNCPGPQCRTT